MAEHLTLTLEGFTYDDLNAPERLQTLTNVFHERVKGDDPLLYAEFIRAMQGSGLSPTETSSVIVRMAPHLSRFIARLFGVEDACRLIRLRTERESIIFMFKKEFVVRRALKRITADDAVRFDSSLLDVQVCQLRRVHTDIADTELATAALAVDLMAHERQCAESVSEDSRSFLADLADRLVQNPAMSGILPHDRDDASLKGFLARVMTLLEQWVAVQCSRHHAATSGWVSFTRPHALNYARLVGPTEHLRRRAGFDLTDARFSTREVMNEVDYCILCHERDKDSCSKGLLEKGVPRKNPLGFPLRGCPLDQKISESHALQSDGDPLAALAVIMIDNPMVPGTGHRICNDCMKACIYQKQDPVNIPQIETSILTEVLDLPWGFEIYSLLTRWNPLNVARPFPLPYNGVNVLVVGLGPAGYTLAHYLLNDGFGVVAIDGLKIEPLPAELLGDGTGTIPPLRDFASIRERLSERVMAGFGGVSEYGITVRWDKNFLTVLYLTLARRRHFRIYDGVRFGGTMTLEDAWSLGFAHVCLAVGAGKPTFVSMGNNLIRGVRKASDFLMALQLTGAGREDSMANLQVRLPALVIGGGLTAIDTATELLAYYPVQVLKIKKRYRRLVEVYGADAVDRMFTGDERDELRTFLTHADALDTERARAVAAGQKPDFVPLLQRWGGVHIYYRKSMADSPAYRLNHEEIIKSLEEGITFVEQMNPVEVVPDANGAVQGMVFEQMSYENGKWRGTGSRVSVPAGTVMVAAGTVPNVMYEREHPGSFLLDERDEYFERHTVNGEGSPVVTPAEQIGFFTSYHDQGHFVTFHGDTHPDFAGNVVRAMASAKQGYREVARVLEPAVDAARGAGPGREGRWRAFSGTMDEALRATVVRVARLTPTITEIVVHAPMAARAFRPGQFFRLQSYEADAPHVEETLLLMEGIALTGAWVDPGRGEIGLIALEVGASSRLCALLQPGQRVVVMGPTGTPTEITRDGTVLLLGGGLGNAVLFSIARAFKQRNNRVIYFAGYRKREDLFKREEIEASTDVVVYSVDAGPPIVPRRPQDRSCVGTIVDAMIAYTEGKLGPQPSPLHDADRVIAIGSDRMMRAVAGARHGSLKPHLRPDHVAIASINSPMQCMMKAVCAQCLQRHVDPSTGREEFVFTCVNQDQCMDAVDFDNLHERLTANSVMEKVTNRWLDYILARHPLPRV